ncbi:MAG: hypothetical protein HOQ05_10770 [Corynebacteriales bacterium]|nr:hypothetical protein [Mycobacteriales bacterium]
MSPRKNRRQAADQALNVAAARVGVERLEHWRGEQWRVRMVTGGAKTYRCPGCDHEIVPKSPHIVAWPSEFGGPAERRHWHTACWRARERRSPLG